VTAGQAVAYAVGWALVGRGHERVGGGGWRALVALGAAPALVQAGMLLAGVAPESPRWLVGKGRGVEARRVLERVYGGGGAARALVTKLEREVGEEREADGGKGVRGALAELLGRPDNRRALGVACMLQAAQQLCGFVRRSPSPSLPIPNRDRTRSCTSRPPSSPWSASASRPRRPCSSP
jgi:SP family myo-inositol transporter-like MFS transporter 13